MATVYKTFLNNDIASTRTLLHEAIPVTGTILSGVYDGGGTQYIGNSETNIKNYAHGMFQSIYDYPYLSSSANHLFDITVGISPNSGLSKSLADSAVGDMAVQQSKKINIYNQMAQLLVGYDTTGSILEFCESGSSDPQTGTKMRECVFLNFSRLLTKDEIKKGSFQIVVGTGSANATAYTAWASGPGRTMWGPNQLVIEDVGGDNDYRVNSPAGEYGFLSATAGSVFNVTTGSHGKGVAGLLFYQAGIAVLSASIFTTSSDSGIIAGNTVFNPFPNDNSSEGYGRIDFTFSGSVTSSVISASADMMRHRIKSLSFNNTTELNSTIHFCRVNHNDYNYSSNPTYLTQSQIRVKNNTMDAPVSYITTVGLYSADNELLAVAKLSEPLKKDPTNEMTVRVRLDY